MIFFSKNIMNYNKFINYINQDNGFNSYDPWRKQSIDTDYELAQMWKQYPYEMEQAYKAIKNGYKPTTFQQPKEQVVNKTTVTYTTIVDTNGNKKVVIQSDKHKK